MVFPEPVASSGCRARFSAGTSSVEFSFVDGGVVSPPTPGSVALGGSAARAAASVVPSADIAGTRWSRRRCGVQVPLRTRFLATKEHERKSASATEKFLFGDLSRERGYETTREVRMCRVIACFVQESRAARLEVRTPPSPFPVPEPRRFRPARPVPLPRFFVRFVPRLFAERVVQRHLLRGLLGQAGHLFLNLRAKGRQQVVGVEAFGSGAGAPRRGRRVPGRVGREPATARVPSGTGESGDVISIPGDETSPSAIPATAGDAARHPRAPRALL